MKNYFILILILFAGINLSAQTFCLRLANPSVSGGKFNVDVQIAGSIDFGLGSSNFVFDFNELGIDNPILESSPLLGFPPYFYSTVSVSEPNNGQVSFNIELAAPDQFAFPVTTAYQTIGTVEFDIIDGMMTSDNNWLYNGGSTQTVVYDDDEATQLFATDAGMVCLEPLNSPLPIIIRSFTAAKFESVSSILDWTTSSEVNGSHFEVERSDDAVNWEHLGKVDAVGESDQEVAYQYIDRNVGVLRSNGTYYYRLKMVDNDGSFEYSDVRSVTFQSEGINVSVYPNPVTDKLSVEVSSDDNEGANVIIYDNTGKILLKNDISSNGISEIDVNNVPSGIILMKVVKNNSVFTKKIIKVD